jgi:hypothetical protein
MGVKRNVLTSGKHLTTGRFLHISKEKTKKRKKKRIKAYNRTEKMKWYRAQLTFDDLW